MHTELSVQKSLQQILESIFSELSIDATSSMVRFDTPAEGVEAHFATSCALQAFSHLTEEQKSAYRSPRALAEAVRDRIQSTLATDPVAARLIADIAVAGPGFINVTLSSNGLIAHAAKYAEDAEELQALVRQRLSSSIRSERRLIEYVGPNTNKPLHIGHLRNAALGVAMANIWERSGHEVTRATIFNDRGLHIIKSVWAFLMLGQRTDQTKSASELQDPGDDWQAVLDRWMTHPDEWLRPEEMQDARLQKSDHFIGHWYQRADAFAEDDAISTVWSVMLQHWENPESSHHEQIRQIWQTLNEYFYAGFAETTKRLGVRFDEEHASYESKIYQAGKQIVLDGAERGIFERLPDGAIIVRLEEKYHLPDKILLRKDGTGIYMTFDIELARQRSALGYDQLYWLVGADQLLYFQQLFAVCELLGFGQREQFHHFSYGMVRLPEGKMSSRKGVMIYADELLDQAVDSAAAIMAQTQVAKSLSEAERAQVVEAVGVGAVQWSMLSQDPQSEVTFDIAKSVSFRGFAGPYIQYTSARCQSVWRQAQAKKIDYITFGYLTKYIDIEIEKIEIAHLRNLLIYTDVLERVSVESAPQLLTTYLHELAQSYNTLYAELPILAGLDSDQPLEQKRAQLRVMLTVATGAVLSDGLGLLGMAAPEKM